ncbi:hypothetical protein OH491_24305 [Termitidicoccus mucosus]|uniref:Uncharacterized protein n=1 Tax=Termitidicoccus mucosus TaxID=1184151 RepID=A0A178IP01_9BACT|nr:hypothetical protein AW736_02140 [Opitutaceae bacterium TSB47]
MTFAITRIAHTFTLPGNQYIKIAPGVIMSNLKVETRTTEDVKYNAAIDGFESLLLAMAGAGFPMDTNEMKEAVETAIDAIAHNCS